MGKRDIKGMSSSLLRLILLIKNISLCPSTPSDSSQTHRNAFHLGFDRLGGNRFRLTHTCKLYECSEHLRKY